MGSSDTSVKVLKALGHPLRLKIVAGLVKAPTCVRDIRGCLDLPQAVVSQHLAILRTSGIIEGKRQGVEIHYAVIDPFAKTIIACLD